MAPPEAALAASSDLRPRVATRRLIVNADDFGRSAEINAAVVRAHDEGVLTSASLMVNEPGFEEAVRLARERPMLGIGLHVTLACGKSALTHGEIPGLAHAEKQFRNNPVAAGMAYFFRPSLKHQLALEVRAQFDRFMSSGLPLDHVNGHLHFHLHPTVLPLVLKNAERCGARAIRLTRDPFRLNARLVRGRWLFRAGQALIFSSLSRRAAAQIKRLGLRHTKRVFGLLQDSRVDEDFILRLLELLPAGDSELYSHPSLTHFKKELDALVSPRVKRLISELDIQLIRYQDL